MPFGISDNDLSVDGANEQLNNNSLADLFTAYARSSAARLNQDIVAADAANLVIDDDVPKSAGQEFLGLDTAVGTPEPAAWMLPCGGFLALILQVRTRLRRAFRVALPAPVC